VNKVKRETDGQRTAGGVQQWWAVFIFTLARPKIRVFWVFPDVSKDVASSYSRSSNLFFDLSTLKKAKQTPEHRWPNNTLSYPTRLQRL
jgi:hypothetical protein